MMIIMQTVPTNESVGDKGEVPAVTNKILNTFETITLEHGSSTRGPAHCPTH